MGAEMIGGIAGGAGLGLLETIGQDHAYQAKMKQLAETTRYSPWTKMSMAQPEVPNGAGNILAGAAGGGMQGQAMGNPQAQDTSNPWAGMQTNYVDQNYKMPAFGSSMGSAAAAGG